jgi:hypothetical protein
MPAKNFFIKRNGKVSGPFTSAKIQALRTARKFHDDDRISQAVDGPWMRIPGTNKQSGSSSGNRPPERRQKTSKHKPRREEPDPHLTSEFEDDVSDGGIDFSAAAEMERDSTAFSLPSPEDNETEDEPEYLSEYEVTAYKQQKIADIEASTSHLTTEGDNLAMHIIAAMVTAVLFGMCCGLFAFVPMAIYGLRVYMIRENTVAMGVYLGFGILASIGGGVVWFLLAGAL